MKTVVKLMLVILLLAAFVFLTFVDIFSTEGLHDGFYGVVEAHHALIMGVLGILGIVIGAVMYAMLDAKIERAADDAKSSAELLLRFLDPHQKKILQHLINHDEQVNQRDLTYLPGLDKLKVHRALKTLQTKGAIIIEKHGKVNKINFSQDVRQLFKKT